MVLWIRQQKYALKLIMAGLTKCAKTSISMAYLGMCAEMIRRMLYEVAIRETLANPGHPPENRGMN
jgi:hypothetical protein